MMMKSLSLFFLFFAFSCSHHHKVTTQDWRDKSKDLTQEYAISIGDLYPEYVSDMGFTQFEHLTTPYSKDFDKERYALAHSWQGRLKRMLKQEENPELRTDMNILLDRVTMDMEEIEFGQTEGVIPFLPVSESLFLNLKDLIRKDSSKLKLSNALSRFRYYVKGDEEQLPMVDGYMAYTINKIKNLKGSGKSGFWPTRYEVETYLEEADDYLKASEELLSTWKEEEWKSDFEEFKAQEARYRDFVKKEILPHTRKTNKTPYNVYAFMLKDMGIKEDPKKLIQMAKEDYQKTYQEFRSLAAEIAQENQLKQNDPVSVIRFLQEKKILNSDELLKLYQKTNEELFQIVKKHDLLTIKERPNIIIRFATKAEAQSLPAPYFVNSPFFGADKDRPSEFVITPADGGRDDFNFPEAVITLTAHEAMPGHALQYHVMKERGTTLMRAQMAFNSVNVEGWGLYAEDLVYPYLSKKGQFVTLQRRLWRQARMFLDPELNLGFIKPQRVMDVFMKDLGFSKLFSLSELNRYSFIMPGQANAYYFGYKKLMEMKVKLKGEKCFNDAVLNMGVLPLSEISARLEKLSCEK